MVMGAGLVIGTAGPAAAEATGYSPRRYTPPSATAPQHSYAPAPGGSNDRFVPQSFDRTGAFVPPHYEPKRRPKFQGHFYEGQHPQGFVRNPPPAPPPPPDTRPPGPAQGRSPR
ncbi:protein of unknown function [Rhodovastum atsumiense]|nr:protein of unknown function [Rhodovastum atsumiense]